MKTAHCMFCPFRTSRPSDFRQHILHAHPFTVAAQLIRRHAKAA